MSTLLMNQKVFCILKNKTISSSFVHTPLYVTCFIRAQQMHTKIKVWSSREMDNTNTLRSIHSNKLMYETEVRICPPVNKWETKRENNIEKGALTSNWNKNRKIFWRVLSWLKYATFKANGFIHSLQANYCSSQW